MSTLEDRLNQELKEAMKARDQRRVDAIKMVKSRLAEKRTSPNFKGPVDDGVVAEVIRSYMKGLQKAIDEMTGMGGANNPVVEKYKWELEYLEGFLPKMMSEKEVRELVRATIKELGVSGPKAIGRVMGVIMKTHKGRLDGALARRIVEEELGDEG